MGLLPRCLLCSLKQFTNLSGCFLIYKMGMTAPKCLAGACLCWWVLPKCWIQSSQTTVCTCPHASQMRCQLENSMCNAFSHVTATGPQTPHKANRAQACSLQRSLTCPGLPQESGPSLGARRVSGSSRNLLELFTTTPLSTSELPHPFMKATSGQYFFQELSSESSAQGRKHS